MNRVSLASFLFLISATAFGETECTLEKVFQIQGDYYPPYEFAQAQPTDSQVHDIKIGIEELKKFLPDEPSNELKHCQRVAAIRIAYGYDLLSQRDSVHFTDMKQFLLMAKNSLEAAGVDLSEEEESLYYLLGIAHIKLGDLDEALGYFDEALVKRLRQFKGARADSSSAESDLLEAAFRYIKASFFGGFIHLKKRDWEGVIEYLDNPIQIVRSYPKLIQMLNSDPVFPDWDNMRLYMARAYQRTGKPERMREVLGDLSQSTESIYYILEAHRELAFAAILAGNEEEAEKSFRMMFGVTNTDPYAIAYFALLNPEEGMEDVRGYAEDTPPGKEWDAGLLWFLLLETEDEIESWTKTMLEYAVFNEANNDKIPDGDQQADTWFFVGEGYRLLGNQEKAKGAYEKCVALPEFPDKLEQAWARLRLKQSASSGDQQD